MSDNFCAVPFIQLLLDPRGVIYPCCMRYDHPLGDIKKEGVLEIWNGEKMQALRKEFLSGKIKTCKIEMLTVKCQRWNAHLEHLVERKTVQTKGIRRIDVRLNGKCNLQCVMCPVWTWPNGRYEGSDFWEKGPTEIFPNLLELEILGGEPFVQRDTFRLIDAVSAVNTDCQWLFTTNANWKFTPKIREYLDKVNIRIIVVSIDSLDSAVYAGIRKLGRLDRALQTVEGLLTYREARRAEGREFQMQMRMVVRSDNYREVPEYVRYTRERGIGVSFHLQREPKTGSLGDLTKSERRKALGFLTDCWNDTQEEQLVHVLARLKATLPIPRSAEART